MRFFNAQATPSALAEEDFARLITTHRSAIQRAQQYQAGEETRQQVGLTLGALGGLGGVGTLVAVGTGALSATILPLVLPLVAIVGVAGLASAAINRMATGQAAQQEAALTRNLTALEQGAQQRGFTIPSVPSLNGLARRVDAQQGREATSPTAADRVTPGGRRPGMA